MIEVNIPSTSDTACFKLTLSMWQSDSSNEKLFARICCSLAKASSKSLWNSLIGDFLIDIWDSGLIFSSEEFGCPKKIK